MYFNTRSALEQGGGAVVLPPAKRRIGKKIFSPSSHEYSGGGHAGAFVSPTFLIGANITPENCSVLGPFQKYFPREKKGGGMTLS